jgi:hypothetical protein
LAIPHDADTSEGVKLLLSSPGPSAKEKALPIGVYVIKLAPDGMQPLLDPRHIASLQSSLLS